MNDRGGMMSGKWGRLGLAAALLLGGCIARTAVGVATLPVRAGAKVVDWSTTSQTEADRNYGRRMRKAEEREGRERRAWANHCRAVPTATDCTAYPGFRAGPDGEAPPR